MCTVCMYRYALYIFVFYYFFFFKQKTAYEMRISDWSSDVCSSDLAVLNRLSLNAPRNWVANIGRNLRLPRSLRDACMWGYSRYCYEGRMTPVTKSDRAVNLF